MRSRLWLAALVLLTTEPGGCEDEPDTTLPPVMDLAEAERIAADRMGEASLGPVTVTECVALSPEYVGTAAVCRVEAQGRAVQVIVSPGDDSDAGVSLDGETLSGVSSSGFVRSAVRQAGRPAEEVACTSVDDVSTCWVQEESGDTRVAELRPSGLFFDVVLTAPGATVSQVVGGGPQLWVDRTLVSRDGGATLRGRWAPNSSTGSRPSQVCAWLDARDEDAVCSRDSARGRFELTLGAPLQGQVVRARATDAAGATTSFEMTIPETLREPRVRMLSPRPGPTAEQAFQVAWRTSTPFDLDVLAVLVDGLPVAWFETRGFDPDSFEISEAWTEPGPHHVQLWARSPGPVAWTAGPQVTVTYRP